MAQMKYKDGVTWKPLAPSYKQHTDATTRITTLETITNDAKVSATKEKTFNSLDARLEESEQDLATHEEQINEVMSEMADIATQDIKNKASNLIAPSLTTNYLKRLESYDNIISMPNNANGQVYLTLQGQSLKNELLYNRETWTEWTKSAGVIGNSAGLEFTSDGVSYKDAILSVNFKPNTKYVIIYTIMSTTLTQNFLFGGSGNPIEPAVSIPKIIGNNKFIFTSKSSFLYNNCRFLTMTSEPSGNKIKLAPNIRIFELPAGSQIETDANTLTADQLAVKYSYIKGGEVRNTLTQNRVVSRGRNLVDWFKLNVNVATIYRSRNIPINSNLIGKNISLDFNTSKYVSLDFRDNASNKIGSTFGTNSGKAINIIVPNSTTMLKATIDVNGGWTEEEFKNLNVMMNLGNISTPHEPYKESIKYTPNVGVLRNLPNLVADKIFTDADGKTWKVQNVSGDYVLQASDITSVATGATVQYITIPLTKFANVKAQAITSIDGGFKIDGFNVEQAGTIDNLPAYSFRTSDTSLFLSVPIGTYVDLTAVRTALAGIIINYQLATPITTEIQCVGELEVYPSGEVEAEPAHWGYATGATSTVTTADLPIKSIRKVVMSELSTTGKLIQTDVTANCTFTATTLTIGSYDSSKVYFYDLEIDSQYSTNGYKVLDVEVDNGIVTHDYLASVADWVLTANEAKATMLVCSNAGGSAKIIAPAMDGKMYAISNTSGQNITVKTATSTGFIVKNKEKRILIYNGTDFILADNIQEQEDWITPTLLNGAAGTIQYRKTQFGRVEFKGTLTIPTQTTAFSLPVGYRPSAITFLTLNEGPSGVTNRRIAVTDIGAFYVYGSSENQIELSGFSFVV